jgi:chaperone modulatory protein CbpM
MAQDLTHEGDLLDENMALSFDEFCEACRVEAAWIEQLLAHGALAIGERQSHIPARHIIRVRKASRLQRDFDLNMPGVALALELLDEIERLRAELTRRSRS